MSVGVGERLWERGGKRARSVEGYLLPLEGLLKRKKWSIETQQNEEREELRSYQTINLQQYAGLTTCSTPPIGFTVANDRNM